MVCVPLNSKIRDMNANLDFAYKVESLIERSAKLAVDLALCELGKG